MLILEPEDSPRPAYAWITGYGYASDGNKLAAEGIADAARIALANASRRADEVDYICAWGPGHRAIDANESTALLQIFGQKLTKIPVSSIKGAIGTALAAAGAIEVLSTALSMRHGQIPPTVNWESPDPQCPLNLNAQTRYLSPNLAMVNAHGLSGSNAVVVMERKCPH